MNTIQPAEIKNRIEQGEKLYLIDVREDEEVAAGMIPGAIHLPMSELAQRVNEIEQGDELILICRSGNRSGKVYEYLESLGFKHLKSMSGGMLEWEKL